MAAVTAGLGDETVCHPQARFFFAGRDLDLVIPQAPAILPLRIMLKAGIVGLPNVGKSTLFNAVTRTRKAQAANYPFCTIDPNVGIVTVPDERLQVLQQRAPAAVPALCGGRWRRWRGGGGLAVGALLAAAQHASVEGVVVDVVATQGAEQLRTASRASRGWAQRRARSP